MQTAPGVIEGERKGNYRPTVDRGVGPGARLQPSGRPQLPNIGIVDNGRYIIIDKGGMQCVGVEDQAGSGKDNDERQ